MPNELLSFRKYAERIGVNASVVSRQVARGAIPTVSVGDKMLIDPEAADRARSLNLRTGGPGGSPERLAAEAAKWRAKTGRGFDYGQLRLLGALWAHGAQLMAEGLRLRGVTDDAEIARASGIFQNIVGTAAHCCFDEVNADKLRTPEAALPVIVREHLTDEAEQLFQNCAQMEDRPNDPDDGEDFWPDDYWSALFARLDKAKLQP